MVTKEQELMELLQEQEALIKRAAGNVPTDRINPLDDPVYANIYIQLAAEAQNFRGTEGTF